MKDINFRFSQIQNIRTMLKRKMQVQAKNFLRPAIVKM